MGAKQKSPIKASLKKDVERLDEMIDKYSIYYYTNKLGLGYYKRKKALSDKVSKKSKYSDIFSKNIIVTDSDVMLKKLTTLISNNSNSNEKSVGRSCDLSPSNFDSSTNRINFETEPYNSQNAVNIISKNSSKNLTEKIEKQKQRILINNEYINKKIGLLQNPYEKNKLYLNLINILEVQIRIKCPI
jgi:hypothetical protein